MSSKLSLASIFATLLVFSNVTHAKQLLSCDDHWFKTILIEGDTFTFKNSRGDMVTHKVEQFNRNSSHVMYSYTRGRLDWQNKKVGESKASWRIYNNGKVSFKSATFNADGSLHDVTSSRMKCN
ncbi:hypothetical protein [Vibrio cyclitrophicus]|uniref:hypothetical protein n=1 Tax=Vibrio cyclitrophicus TaxID=47951 RepID=UPI0011B504BB|nr:hypothetical protein [Vibrio cyclitrophicus]